MAMRKRVSMNKLAMTEKNYGRLKKLGKKASKTKAVKG